MRLDIFCKQGKLQVLDDGTMQVKALFGAGVVWSVPYQDVTSFTTQPEGTMAASLLVRTTNGSHFVGTVAYRNLKKIQEVFPHLPINEVQKTKWYQDIAARTHVKTYTSEKEMQRDLEAATQYGWMLQSTTGIAGHVNVGRTTTAAALTGGVSLLFGASRSKDKITITFVRTPEWLAQNG